MFTDIAGYSALMEENEPRTIEIIERHNQIVFPIVTATGGTIIDAIGDGLLLMFGSVRESVNCGLQIQHAIDEYNQTADKQMQFHLRIGIHLGEIWDHEGRIFGNGVNVAARVQPYATPGGICITEDVQRQIENHRAERIVSIGVQPLRNISRKIELYSIETGCETDRGEPGTGEFDAIKEQLLHEREKVARERDKHRGSQKSSDLGEAIENRVFNFVERVMDTAIDKWDKLPEEKKRAAAEQTGSHIGRSVAKSNTRENEDDATIVIAGNRHGKHSRKESGGELGAGIVFGVGFGIGYFAFDIGWMIIPMILFGAFPLASGLTKIIKRFVGRRAEQKQRPKELEHRILEAASQLGGKVTVVQIATKVGIGLDEASRALDEMTRKGYLLQHILETGVIQYEFPALSDET